MSESTETVDDLSIFIIPGRVDDATLAIDQAKEAEALGFRGVWLCERFESTKESGAVLGATAGATSRIDIGTAPVVTSARLPLVTASLGSTLQSVSRGRFTLGVGRGSSPGSFRGWGFSRPSFEDVIDYCGILRRLWRGETVDYDGPIGAFSGLRLHDLPSGPPPKIMFCHVGGPKASKVAANPVFDVVMPGGMITADALHTSVATTLAECERIGRDPTTIRFTTFVASAPELDEAETYTLIATRMLFGLALVPNLYAQLNGWDLKLVGEILDHPMLRNFSSNAVDQAFNSPAGRAALLDVVKRVPESWIHEIAAIGSLDECLKSLHKFKAAGVDELALYTATPKQNAALLSAWRDATAAS